MSWLGLVAGLAGALLFGLGAVAQASGVRRRAQRPDDLLDFVRSAVRDPWTMGVVAAYLAGFVLHAVAIWLLPLYLAQAVTAMSFPVTAVASTLVGERLGPAGWGAVTVVTAGLVLLGVGSGEPGGLVNSGAFVALVWAGVAALALLALVGRRLGRGALAGGVLGTLAGLGYAGSAVAVRGIGTPLDLAVVAAALAVPAYSLVAFWLYSLGLHSDEVSATTAPMIVGQTFVPALVGVLLLGDGVRDGWGAAVAAGLVLATAGAAWLAAPRRRAEQDGQPGIRTAGAAATASSPGPARRPGPGPRRSP